MYPLVGNLFNLCVTVDAWNYCSLSLQRKEKNIQHSIICQELQTSSCKAVAYTNKSSKRVSIWHEIWMMNKGIIFFFFAHCKCTKHKKLNMEVLLSSFWALACSPFPIDLDGCWMYFWCHLTILSNCRETSHWSVSLLFPIKIEALWLKYLFCIWNTLSNMTGSFESFTPAAVLLCYSASTFGNIMWKYWHNTMVLVYTQNSICFCINNILRNQDYYNYILKPDYVVCCSFHSLPLKM